MSGRIHFMFGKERLDTTVAIKDDIVMHESSPEDGEIVFARVRDVLNKGAAVVENLNCKGEAYEIRLFHLRVLFRRSNIKRK